MNSANWDTFVMGCDTGSMILRMLRQPHAGRPSLLARAVALLVVVGLVAITAPVLGPPILTMLQWLGGVL